MERYRYLVELDNSSETIYNHRHEKDTWHRKIRLHEAYQDQVAARHRVLVVTTRSKSRLVHILDAAARFAKNVDRTLFLGVHLPEYLAAKGAVTAPCFLDHRDKAAALIPAHTQIDR